MDKLRLSSSWSSTLLSRATVRVTISGLLLQGAAFNGKYLSEAAADAAELIQVKPCTLAYTPAEDSKPYAEGEYVSVPLYYDTLREKALLDLDLPIKGDGAIWVTSGVALFLND